MHISPSRDNGIVQLAIAYEDTAKLKTSRFSSIRVASPVFEWLRRMMEINNEHPHAIIVISLTVEQPEDVDSRDERLRRNVRDNW